MGSMRARLQEIPVSARSLDRYRGLVPAEQIERARAAARPLAGTRVLYVATAPPEAADASASLAALLAGLGLEVRRVVLHGDAEFTAAAADFADALRGSDWARGDRDWDALREACEAAAVEFDPRPFDAVVVQGAGAAPLVEGRRGGAAWLWRTGVDASEPADGARGRLLPMLGAYSGLSFALPGFVPAGLDAERLRVVPGAFDPLAAAATARGPWPAEVDPSRPLVCRIGRLDSWADPVAAVEAWLLARGEAPGLQLAVAGRVDPSDPEAPGVLEEVRAYADGEEDLHLVTDRNGASPRTIAAIATLARCALRGEVGDEFDPGVAASQWRGTPVIGGGESIEAQVRNGEGGFIAADPERQAVRIAAIANGPRRALQVARAGRDRVLPLFSVVRLLGDELDWLEVVVERGRAAGGERAAWPRTRLGSAA